MHVKLSHIVRAALFVGVLVALHLLLRHAYWFYFSGLAPSLSKEREYIRSASPCDLLFLGNSHILVGFDEHTIPRSAMCSSLREPYAVTYYKLKRILDGRPAKPKAVVLQLDLHSFSDYRTEMLEGPGWAPYVDYCEVARSRQDFVPVFQDWVAFRAAPYAGKAAEVINHVTGLESGRERMERSLEKLFGPIGTPEVAASLAAHYHLAARRWDDDESVEYFRRIAELCKVNGVSMVWVRLPVTRLYHEAASDLLPMPEWEALVQRMLDAHPEIILINYHEALFGQSSMFKDSDHLSAEGRAWATAQLAADLRAREILPPVVSILMPGAKK